MSLDVNSNATNGWNCLRTLTAVNSSSANIHVPPVTRQLIPPGRHMFHPFNRVYPKPDQEKSDSDAKQPWKNPMRKTVDYYSSVIQMLEVQLRPTCLDPLVVDCIQSVIDYIQRRTWQRDLRDRPSLQPDVCYYPKLEPPSCYADTASNAITTRLTKVGSLRSWHVWMRNTIKRLLVIILYWRWPRTKLGAPCFVCLGRRKDVGWSQARPVANSRCGTDWLSISKLFRRYIKESCNGFWWYHSNSGVYY